jgi:hypothetical protein
MVKFVIFAVALLALAAGQVRARPVGARATWQRLAPPACALHMVRHRSCITGTIFCMLLVMSGGLGSTGVAYAPYARSTTAPVAGRSAGHPEYMRIHAHMCCICGRCYPAIIASLRGRVPNRSCFSLPLQAVAAKKGKDGSTYTKGWVHVNSTGIVDISSIKTKNITLTTFISVESYSKYANVSMLSSTAFQVTRTATKHGMKSSVLVGYSANNTSNGTTKGALMVVFPKANWKGELLQEPLPYTPSC